MHFSKILFFACSVTLSACQTPTDGSTGLSGGVRETKLSPKDYEFISSVNGFTAPGQLQPQLLRRAQEVGLSNGFASFAVHEPRAYFNLPGNSFSARARVQYYTPGEAAVPGPQRLHGVRDPIPFLAKDKPQGRAVHSATLEGNEPEREKLFRVWIEPIFFEAEGLRSGGFVGRPTYFVTPGKQRVIGYLFFVRSFGLPPQGISVNVEAELEPGKSYRMNVDYDGVDFAVWVEESATGRHAGPVLKL